VNEPTRFGKAVQGEIDRTRQQRLRVTISAGLMSDRLIDEPKDRASPDLDPMIDRASEAPPHRAALTGRSANAISGSIIENSARWRLVFEFSARKAHALPRLKRSSAPSVGRAERGPARCSPVSPASPGDPG
jgi:hypothetical protein